MTGIAPEPADRAIARLLAGGLDDWRDITDTVAAPIEVENGRSYERDVDTPAPPAEPEPH